MFGLLIFCDMSEDAARRFDELKSTEQMQKRGPPQPGESIPRHRHSAAALYFVREGAAWLIADGKKLLLGEGQALNAVVIPAGVDHEWQVPQVRGVSTIPYVFGDQQIMAVIGV